MKSKPKKLKKINEKNSKESVPPEIEEVSNTCKNLISSQTSKGGSNQFWTGTAVKELAFRAKTGAVGSQRAESEPQFRLGF